MKKEFMLRFMVSIFCVGAAAIVSNMSASAGADATNRAVVIATNAPAHKEKAPHRSLPKVPDERPSGTNDHSRPIPGRKDGKP